MLLLPLSLTELVIDADVWMEVAGLDMGGIRKFEETIDGYNKM